MATVHLNVDSDCDSIMEEVSLQDMHKPTENARESLERCASELGTMLWRLSSHTSQVTRYLMRTVVVTRSLVDSLDSECATKWEPGKGRLTNSSDSSSLLSRIIDSLEKEIVEDDDDRESVTSASSENTDFVGGHRRLAGDDLASEFLCDLEDWDDDLS